MIGDIYANDYQKLAMRTVNKDLVILTPEDVYDLYDIYFRLEGFLDSQCYELTDNQRDIFEAILDDFDNILKRSKDY